MIIAIDASTKSLGFAIFDNNKRLIDYGCITASSTDLINRISKIIKELKIVFDKYIIEKILIEEVRPENGLQQNIKTHRALTWMQAAIAFLAHDTNKKIEIEYIYPSEWRKWCGIHTGRGIKRETLKQKDIEFVKEKYNINVNDDIADAIGIGYGYLHSNFKSDKEIISFK